MKRIAFLVQLPKNVSPGQRFRIEQFEPDLAAAGFVLHTYPFLGRATYRVLYQPGHLLQKAGGVLFGFLKRFAFLFIAWRYDYIFLQREAAPVGPPLFEWILARVLRRRLVLDFDDAIRIPSEGGDSIARQIKCFWKVKWICRWSYKVSVGNEYLAAYARQYSRNVVLIPTCVDTNRRFNRLQAQSEDLPVIGWTGSHSTLFYLDLLYPILKELEQTHAFEFLVICNRPPDFELRSLRFVKWNEASEIDDLLRIHIGVMPLVADAWSQGKCGFKLIQYLALGIPAVASPVGVNTQIVLEGKTGFLCATPAEWKAALVRLLEDKALRQQLGRAGRTRIVDHYSLEANAGAFMGLFS